MAIHPQGWRKAMQFTPPVFDEGDGNDYKRGTYPSIAALLQHGNDLDRLAETHLIGKQAAQTRLDGFRKPLVASFLVGIKCSPKTGKVRASGS